MAGKASSRKPKTNARNKIPKDGQKEPEERSVLPAKENAIEAELEKLVFGDLAGFQEGLRAQEYEEASADEGEDAEEALVLDRKKGQDITALQDDELFFVDTGSALALPPQEPISPNGEEKGEKLELDQPAWYDSDDERLTVSLASHNRTRKLRDTAADDLVSGVNYSQRLRAQFERIYPVPEWALPPKPKRRRRSSAASSSSDDDMDVDAPVLSAPPLSALLQSAGGYTKPSNTNEKLRPEILDIARLKDANAASPSVSGIQALSFHPRHPLLLTAGFDSTLRLYHIDGKNNPPATALHIKNTPIYTALIHPDGQRVVVGGRRRYFHIWDLETGVVEAVTRVYGHQKDQKSMERFRISPSGSYLALIGARGTVQFLDATTSQWIASAKVDGNVADIAWRIGSKGEDSEVLSILTTQAEVFEYSPTSKSVLHRWANHGGVSCTTIATSPDGRWTAIGSASGVVDVYDRRTSAGPRTSATEDPTLVRSLENLVTSINVLALSADSQLLCMASRGKRDALRLVHLPSVTVYKNWPTSNTPLGRVTAATFAPGAGKDASGSVMAVGNEAGKVRLFEIR